MPRVWKGSSISSRVQSDRTGCSRRGRRSTEMCGVIGLVDIEPRETEGLLALLRHRGPDDQVSRREAIQAPAMTSSTPARATGATVSPRMVTPSTMATIGRK